MGWILLILVFNFNGQYRVGHMDFDTKAQCQEMGKFLKTLGPPKRAEFHHLIDICVQGNNEQDFNNSLNAVSKSEESK